MSSEVVAVFISKFWGVLAGLAAVVFGYGKLNNRLDNVEKKVSSIDSSMSQALDKISEKFDKDRERQDKREDALRSEMRAGFDKLEGRITDLHVMSLKRVSQKNES